MNQTSIGGQVGYAADCLSARQTTSAVTENIVADLENGLAHLLERLTGIADRLGCSHVPAETGKAGAIHPVPGGYGPRMIDHLSGMQSALAAIRDQASRLDEFI